MNSFSPKINELRIIANSTIAAIIDVSEPKLDESVLEKIPRYDRNRHKGSVTCYIRNYLNNNIVSAFSHEIQSLFFEIFFEIFQTKNSSNELSPT